MDYEREYKEMVARAKELHESGNALTKMQMEIICPQLAESEDERIRMALCDIVRDMPYMQTELRAHGLTIEQALAYLEKQKEQNLSHIEYIDYEENLDLAKNAIGMIRDGACYINNHSRNEVLDWLENVPKIIKRLIIKINETEKQKEQKPTWSEEDDYNIVWLIETLLGLDGDKEFESKCKEVARWLNSLPERITKEDDK